MAARLLHIVDESAPEDSLAHLSLLLNQLPPAHFKQTILMLGRPAPVLRLPPDVSVRRAPGVKSMRQIRAIRILQVLRRQPFDLLLMWDLLQHVPVCGEGSASPSLAIVSDRLGIANVLHWHVMGRKHGLQSHFVCLTDSIRQQLVHLGIPGDKVQLIRASVDLAEIRQADRQRLRAELGLPADARVLLTACPPGKNGGQYLAVWVAGILHQIWPDVRMILPGGFREDRRARRLGEECYCPQIFCVAGEQYGPADLLAASDMLVWPEAAGFSVGWLAWAMAAGVPIVATGTPSTRELIRDGQTGFLADSARPHVLATRIRAAWEDSDARRRCVQEAAHQAYEMFRPQKCLDAYLEVLRRLLDDRAGDTQEPTLGRGGHG